MGRPVRSYHPTKQGHMLLFLAARVLSAVGNLVALAIFSRMAGPVTYGEYLLIFAWTSIVYGFSTQWMRFAFFGVYRREAAGDYIASFGVLLSAALIGVAVVLSGLWVSGIAGPEFLTAVFILLVSMAGYEALLEISRTRLKAGTVAVLMLLRAGLVIVFGAAALTMTGSAVSLAFAVALAHVGAAIPGIMAIRDVRLAPSGHAMRSLIIYGWPLLISFGVMAVGQSVDRLLLAHFGGAGALGPYGVVADFLRQAFMVVGESIAMALVTVAKQHANSGEREDADRVLRHAFNACMATATFGAVFFLVFGDVVVRLLVGEAFYEPTRTQIPLFAIAFGFMTMRNFYFAQVIYFSNASHLELIGSLVFVATSALLATLLVPWEGAMGAAIALMSAHIVACVLFVVVGRRHYRMPVDKKGFVVISLMALATLIADVAIQHFITAPMLAMAAKALVFAAAGGAVILRFNLLHLSRPRREGEA
ncbi:MAG: lipopolysaccharide biosynthesis protein [Chelatococcus sp.]|nr:lipopolysaccharide biosynthesis protein [Chelatococcus sp.]